ncbi:MAG: sigma-70 family RNA polymerase sigma factor [Acidobacteriota bacterium]
MAFEACMDTDTAQDTTDDLRVADRSEDGFVRLVDEYKDRIVNYATRLTGDRERAEDVAQETFVRFYRHRARYREEGTVAAYLYRIATNLVRDEGRRRSRWLRLQPFLGGRGDTAVAEPAPRPAPDPRSQALAEETRRQVTRAIASLEIHYRAPLVLREIEGLSYREIADTLGCAEGTVKSRLHKARSLLKEKLTPYWNGRS